MQDDTAEIDIGKLLESHARLLEALRALVPDNAGSLGLMSDDERTVEAKAAIAAAERIGK